MPNAFVSEGDWSDHTRSHPALEWFEPVVTNIFDKKAFDTPYSEIYTDDMNFTKSDGTVVHGGKAAWAEVANLWAPFASYRTVPEYAVVTETDFGWDMLSTAHSYMNLLAPGNERKVKDEHGQEWDLKITAGWRFQFRKDAGGISNGIRIQKIQMTMDSLPAVTLMVRRGMVKPEESFLLGRGA